MLRVLAALVVVLLALVVAALVAGVIWGIDTPRCDALTESVDHCFDASATEKTIGIVLAAAAAAVGALGVAAGVGFVRGRGGGGRLALSVVVTPLLAVAALMFLQISF